MADQDQENPKPVLVARMGQVEVDVPMTVGYYGGIALALSAGMLEPPLAVFIAAIPLFRMLHRPNASWPARLVSQVLQGAAKPVGGDSEGAIRLRTDGTPQRLSILAEARQIARRTHAQ